MFKPDTITVRLLAQVPPFNCNEVAGFIPVVAQKLIADGQAVYVDPPPGLDETGAALPKPKPKAKAKAKPRAKAKPKG